MLRVIAFITGLIFIIFAVFWSFLGGYFAGTICTGTESVVFYTARVCGTEFDSYLCLFSTFNFLLLLGSLVLASQKTIPALIRYVALAVFVIYIIWLVAFSPSVWRAPFFTDPLYPPGA